MAGWDFEMKERKPKRKFIRFKDLILFEDDRVVVINKPTGVASLSDRESEINLQDLGKKYNEALTLAHRLDKPTTGILIFAKGLDMYREVNMAFSNREVIKHYVTLAHCLKPLEEFAIEFPLSMSAKGKAKVDMAGGKESLTMVETEEIFRHCSLMNCHPLTGRTHQIRVHLASAGFPLVGDDTYGGKHLFLSDMKRNYKPNRKMEEPSLTDGFLLHARGINLTLPGDEEPSTFIAPLPKKFETALRLLRKYDRTRS